MKAVVIYESFWGNTAAAARAVAEGLGAQAFSTGQAGPEVLAGAGLVVAGAPILGFSLTTESMRRNLGNPQTKPGARPADLSNPSMRAWLAQLPPAAGVVQCAAFETRLWWSPGSAAGVILKQMAAKGYQPITAGGRFLVTGTYGPLKAVELERARAWGAALAKLAA